MRWLNSKLTGSAMIYDFFLLWRHKKEEVLVWICLGKGVWITWLLNLERFKCKRESACATIALHSFPSKTRIKSLVYSNFLFKTWFRPQSLWLPVSSTGCLLLFLHLSPSSFLFLLPISAPKSPFPLLFMFQPHRGHRPSSHGCLCKNLLHINN